MASVEISSGVDVLSGVRIRGLLGCMKLASQLGVRARWKFVQTRLRCRGQWLC